MALKRMDNVLIVVGNLIGLKNVRATLAMLRTPDGQGGIELDKFHTPKPVRYGPVATPVNALGIRRIMFNVDDIDDVVARMRAHGAELIGEMRYEDSYRLAYIRGPEGIIVGLAEEIRKASPRTGKGAARPKQLSRAKPAGRKKMPAKSAGRKKSGGLGNLNFCVIEYQFCEHGDYIGGRWHRADFFP